MAKELPRIHTQLEQKQEAADLVGAAYEQGFEWLEARFNWQPTR